MKIIRATELDEFSRILDICKSVTSNSEAIKNKLYAKYFALFIQEAKSFLKSKSTIKEIEVKNLIKHAKILERFSSSVNTHHDKAEFLYLVSNLYNKLLIFTEKDSFSYVENTGEAFYHIKQAYDLTLLDTYKSSLEFLGDNYINNLNITCVKCEKDLDRHDNLELAIRIQLLLLNIHEALGQPTDDTLHALSSLYLKKKNLENDDAKKLESILIAKDYAFKAYQKNNDKHKSQYLSTLEGHAYLLIEKEPTEALSLYEDVLKLSEEKEEFNFILAFVYSSMGSIYHKYSELLNQDKEKGTKTGIELYKKSIRAINAAGYSNSTEKLLSSTRHMLTTALLQLGRDCESKNQQEAESYYLEALKYAKENRELRKQANTENQLSTFYATYHPNKKFYERIQYRLSAYKHWVLELESRKLIEDQDYNKYNNIKSRTENFRKLFEQFNMLPKIQKILII